jgi:selenocysteine lyase/cysteine desulfurase
MSVNRRKFVQKIASVAGLSALAPFYNSVQGKSLISALEHVESIHPSDLAPDEDFWHYVQQAYTVNTNIINLNNGGVSPQPLVVQEAVERYNRLSNEAPSFYMWRTLDQGREPLRMKLADLAGCSKEEIAINRNSSEALETIIFGLRLKAGDEVVLTKQDYPNMINAWKQREHRDGIVLKWLDFEFPIDDKELIINKFKEAFTKKTKLVQITHIINWMGQILPAKEIADEAHKRGIEVMIDAAHSFAHINYKIPDLGGDYFGTSLHKWLCAPFGSGLLYVKKEKIKNLYPLFAAPNPEDDNIRKFENLGTRSFAIEQAIGQAVNFHEMIGGERKEKRLHYLKNYWTDKVKDLPKVNIATSSDPNFSCAIALLQVEGMTPGEVGNFLFRNYKIHTTSINWENIHGVRITPNVYTRTKDLDRLVKAITELSKA